MMFKLCVLMCVLLLFDGSTQGVPMHGKLFYVYPDNLYEFDLEQRKKRGLLLDYTGVILFASIDKIDSTHFLIASWSEQGKIIRQFDKNDLTFKGFHLGGPAIYMPKHRKFFYYNRAKLFLADMDSQETGLAIAPDQHFTTVGPVIPVSDDEVVFPIQGNAGRSPPYRYNLVTKRLEQLPFSRPCVPSVWRTATQQLICWDSESDKNYLISLDGDRMEDLHGLPKGRPVLYIPKFDVLLVNGLRLHWFPLYEESPLWAYSFKTHRKEELLSSAPVGVGDIVWVEE